MDGAIMEGVITYETSSPYQLAEQNSVTCNQTQLAYLDSVQLRHEETNEGSASLFVWLFILIGVFCVVIFFLRKLRPTTAKQISTRPAAPTFTPKDRALIEILVEIVDSVDSTNR